MTAKRWRQDVAGRMLGACRLFLCLSPSIAAARYPGRADFGKISKVGPKMLSQTVKDRFEGSSLWTRTNTKVLCASSFRFLDARSTNLPTAPNEMREKLRSRPLSQVSPRSHCARLRNCLPGIVQRARGRRVEHSARIPERALAVQAHRGSCSVAALGIFTHIYIYIYIYIFKQGSHRHN